MTVVWIVFGLLYSLGLFHYVVTNRLVADLETQPLFVPFALALTAVVPALVAGGIQLFINTL